MSDINVRTSSITISRWLCLFLFSLFSNRVHSLSLSDSPRICRLSKKAPRHNIILSRVLMYAEKFAALTKRFARLKPYRYLPDACAPRGFAETNGLDCRNRRGPSYTPRSPPTDGSGAWIPRIPATRERAYLREPVSRGFGGETMIASNRERIARGSAACWHTRRVCVCMWWPRGLVE